MPFRPQQLDNGFSMYQPPAQQPPKENVTTREAIGALFTGDTTTLQRANEETFGILGAAFRQENDVLNVIDLFTRQRNFQDDPSFDLQGRLKKDGMWNDYADNFLGVGSEAEYLAIKQRIAQEEKDRQTLSAAGLAGMLAQVGAGLASPTILLPFVGGARGAAAVGLGVGMGALGGAAQEIPLQLAQETRSLETSVSSIAFSAVIGGVLGGAVAFARRTPREIADLYDMAFAPGAEAIPRPRAAGAAAIEGDARLAPSFGLNETVGQMSPVVRTLSSGFQQGRLMMARLADAGLEFVDSRMAPVGGTVENRIQTHYGPVVTVLKGGDELYAKYLLGQEAAERPFAVQRSKLPGAGARNGKMSRDEFRQAVGRALRNGDKSDIPEVQELAQLVRREILDPYRKQMEEVGMLAPLKEGETGVVGDVSYLTRMYHQERIRARQDKFEDILASHYEQKLVDEFRASLSKLQRTRQRDATRIEDFNRPAEEVQRLREDFEKQLLAIEEGRDAELAELEAAISDKRSAARTFERGTSEREAALAEARALEQSGGEALAQTRAARAEIRNRLANLRRAHSALTERQAKKLDKIDRAEELNFNTLSRLTRRAQKLLNEMDGMTDARFDAELSKLKDRFASEAARFDRNEERIAKIFDDEFEDDLPTSPFVQAAKIETDSFNKLSDIAEAIEEAEVFDRAAARQQVQSLVDAATRKAQGIVERRAVRNARLAEQARDLDPTEAAKRLKQLEDGMKARDAEFYEQWRQKGADSIDPATGVADFSAFARQMAESTTNKILGNYVRLPGVDILMEPRGPELARVLDIDSRLLVDEDGMSFIEDDFEKIIMSYVRTLAPDIELTRALGSFAQDKAMNENWVKLTEEARAVKKQTQDLMRQGVDPKTGKKKEFSQEQIDKAGLEIDKQYQDVSRDIEAVINRMRHMRGLPQDPRGIGARAAKVAANTNVLRFMSNMTIPSLPDLARPIMKYGLLKAYGSAYRPFVKALGEGKWSPRQLRLAGVATDLTLNTRGHQMYDIGDYMVRGSKFEKGLEWASSKIGWASLFEHWNTAMKQMVGTYANAEAMDSLHIIVGGKKASAKDVEAATRFLAQNGIDDDYARRMWEQVQNGGGEEVGGVWWPNTEDWTDPELVRAYNAMLVRETNNTLNMPGVERPLVSDANPFARLVFQFKSFAMTSTTKTLIAGAQSLRRGDMAFLQGVMISLALGTLSYYIAASLGSQKARDDLQSAIAKGNWAKFADEAIDRSGFLGIGGEMRAAFANIPATANLVTFSGSKSTRRGGDNLLDQMFGPTFGDLLPAAANVIAGIPATQSSFHSARTMLPLQNHFLLRHLFDHIEEQASTILPERRS